MSRPGDYTDSPEPGRPGPKRSAKEAAYKVSSRVQINVAKYDDFNLSKLTEPGSVFQIKHVEALRDRDLQIGTVVANNSESGGHNAFLIELDSGEGKIWAFEHEIRPSDTKRGEDPQKRFAKRNQLGFNF